MEYSYTCACGAVRTIQLRYGDAKPTQCTKCRIAAMTSSVSPNPVDGALVIGAGDPVQCSWCCALATTVDEADDPACDKCVNSTVAMGLCRISRCTRPRSRLRKGMRTELRGLCAYHRHQDSVRHSRTAG